MTVSKKLVLTIGIIIVSFLFTVFLSACGEPVEVSFHVDDSQVEKEVEFGTKSPLSGLKVTVKLSDGSIKTLAAGEGGYEVHTGGYDEEQPGDYTMTISYKEFDSYEIVITVLEEEIIDETQDPDVYLEDIAVRENTAKRLFLYGEEFSSEGIVVEEVYSNGEKEVIPSSDYILNSDEYDAETEGTYTIEIYYTPNQGEQYYTSYDVTVTPPDEYSPFEGIALLTNDVQKEFMVGEQFNHDGLVVEKLIREDGVLHTETADPSEVNVRLIQGYDSNTPGEYAVFVSVQYFEVVYIIEVLDFVEDITIEGGKFLFDVGESFSSTSLRVYAEKASGDREQLSQQDYSIDTGGFDPNTEGFYTITVTYLENPDFYKTYEVEVREDYV